MIENIKKYKPEEYEYKAAGYTKSDEFIQKYGYSVFYTNILINKIHNLIKIIKNKRRYK